MESPTHMLEDEMANALKLEKEGKPGLAVKIYEALLKHHPASEKILMRLVINYRKMKAYKKELIHINRLLKMHESFYLPQKKIAADVIALSKKINRSLAGSNKHAEDAYADENIKKLQKRKLLVEQKIKDNL
jgi:hypothetical protein